MLRNLLVLGIVAYFAGVGAGKSAYGNSASENFDVYDEDSGFYRMHYDVDGVLFKNEAPAETSPPTSEEPVKLTNALSATASTSPPVNEVIAAAKPNTAAPPSATPTKPPKNSTVHFILYMKNQAPRVFNQLPKLPLEKDTFILIHGISNRNQREYVSDFFKLGSAVLLDHCDCNIVGVQWEVVATKGSNRSNEYRTAISIGRRLGKNINNQRIKASAPEPFTIIGHDMGNVIAAVLSSSVRDPLEYFYALDQRDHPRAFSDLYLRQDMGLLVQTITTRFMQYNYGHRNFYPDGGNMDIQADEMQNCYWCKSYKLLFDDIRQNGRAHLSTFCSAYLAYESGFCEHFATASYFNRIDANELPIGNYYYTETVPDEEEAEDEDNTY